MRAMICLLDIHTYTEIKEGGLIFRRERQRKIWVVYQMNCCLWSSDTPLKYTTCGTRIVEIMWVEKMVGAGLGEGKEGGAEVGLQPRTGYHPPPLLCLCLSQYINTAERSLWSGNSRHSFAIAITKMPKWGQTCWGLANGELQVV